MDHGDLGVDAAEEMLSGRLLTSALRSVRMGGKMELMELGEPSL